MILLHFFKETGDVSKLYLPLEDGKLELAFTTQQRPAAAVAPPAATPCSAASAGGHSGSSSAMAARRSSSSASAGTLAAIRRTLRKQLPGGRAAANDEPSPAGKGKGKKPQQPYAEFTFDLMRKNLIRGNDGTYYLRRDKCPRCDTQL